MTRRLNHYDVATGWHPLLLVAMAGALVVACGIACQLLQIVVSIKDRNKNLDTTGDPWNGRTLEWSTSSPPPFYNFAITPVVHDRDAFWDMKQRGKSKEPIHYEDIHMPKNTGMGFIIAGLSFVLGFAMVWQIWWLAIIGGIGVIIGVMLRSFDYNIDYYLKAADVEKIELANKNRNI